MNITTILGFGFMAVIGVVIIVSLILVVIGMKKSKNYEVEILPGIDALEGDDDSNTSLEDISEHELSHDHDAEDEQDRPVPIPAADNHDSDASLPELDESDDTAEDVPDIVPGMSAEDLFGPSQDISPSNEVQQSDAVNHRSNPFMDSHADDKSVGDAAVSTLDALIEANGDDGKTNHLTDGLDFGFGTNKN
jgi:hypothetical protein